MTSFAKGDIVRVEYSSPRFIEEWMRGERPVGPGEVGFVKYATATPVIGHRRFNGPPEEAESTAGWHNVTVSVTFPMLGTFGVHSSHLKLVQKATTNEPT